MDEEQLRTLWCGGVSEKVDEEILYELFLNAGPLERVTIPRDKENHFNIDARTNNDIHNTYHTFESNQTLQVCKHVGYGLFSDLLRDMATTT